MVLSAVFVPMAFFGGLLVLSIVSSLLPLFQQWRCRTGSVDPDSGSLCHHAETDCQGDHGEGKKGFFGWFNRMFERARTTTPTA